jgi:hypothetical protein
MQNTQTTNTNKSFSRLACRRRLHGRSIRYTNKFARQDTRLQISISFVHVHSMDRLRRFSMHAINKSHEHNVCGALHENKIASQVWLEHEK